MNNELLCDDLTLLNEISKLDPYIAHSGRKGQKHGIFGASGATRFQWTATYAKGVPRPNNPSNLQKYQEMIDKTKQMSNKELSEDSERIYLENKRLRSIKEQMETDISLRNVERDYLKAFSSPKKQNALLNGFKNIVSYQAKKTVDVGFDMVRNVAKAKVYEQIKEKYGKDFADNVFNFNKKNKNNRRK